MNIKINLYLEGTIPPKWSLDEYSSTVVGNYQKIWEKLSIISSLCHARAPLKNNLIGSLAPSYLFSSTMGGHRGQ
jgi:hypothetical protein